MECNNCESDISLSKNLKRSAGPITEKNIRKCPECGEELETSDKLDSSIVEKGI